MLDPSTNTNPLEPAQHAQEHEEHEQHDGADDMKKKKRSSKDVSKHVFYVVNAQTRLKLTAKNERQMLQWITSLERAARESHYTGKNRFDSFAPIRLNVAAQWLVDGVGDMHSRADDDHADTDAPREITFGIYHARSCLLERLSRFMIGGFLQVCP